MKHLSRLFALLLVMMVPASASAQRGRGAAAAGLSITVQVTDKSGNPLRDVAVATSGPVDRSGTTAENGSIVFRSLRQGTYRLRFEHADFITLERELVLRAQSLDLSIALSAAPRSATPPPAPPPAPVPPPPQSTPARTVAPRTLSLTDYLDRNLIGSEPQRLSLLACAEGGTANLLQVRDPMTGQAHADADEILYVVAGSGVIRIGGQDTRVEPGHFVLVPRTISHNLRRDGRNPLILLSVRAGAPCNETAQPVK
jgi:mannose-6-phosphate isomerase-like protein (cupin superfamily)